MTQYKRRKDKNHAEIMAAFETDDRCDVLDLYQVGGGCPDLLVCISGGNGKDNAGINVLVEIKNGAKAGYTESQDRFNARWRGPRTTVRDVQGVADVIASWTPK